MSECVLKTLACQGLHVGPSEFRLSVAETTWKIVGSLPLPEMDVETDHQVVT